MNEKINKMNRAISDFTRINEKIPNNYELAEFLGISADEVRALKKNGQEPVSLETPIGEDNDTFLGDFIVDENINLENSADMHFLREALESCLLKLTEREAKVLRLRFGLDDGKSHTLEEVGNQFGVTRERIRQIESKALRRMRHPSKSKNFQDYLK